MKFKEGLFLISIMTFILGCSKEDSDFRLSNLDTPIITGYEMRDDYGYIISDIGIPNIKLASESNTCSFIPYPNPCTSHCSIYTQSSNQNSKKSIWLVKAQFQDDNNSSSANYMSNNMLQAGGYPVFESEFSARAISLDFSNLEEGYYRLYLKIDNMILYDNIVISKN